MPEITAITASAPREKLDHLLLLSLALPPLAAGTSTIVGYTVAHWITIIAHKRTGYLVSASCFVVCAIAAGLAGDTRRKLAIRDDTVPEDGRRMFMANLSLMLTALCTLVVLAGTLVLIILQPND